MKKEKKNSLVPKLGGCGPLYFIVLVSYMTNQVILIDFLEFTVNQPLYIFFMTFHDSARKQVNFQRLNTIVKIHSAPYPCMQYVKLYRIDKIIRIVGTEKMITAFQVKLRIIIIFSKNILTLYTIN